MSQQLQAWCEKLKREVTEGAPLARRIRLMTAGEGTIWETWEPVADLDAAQFANEAEQLISALALELPKRRVQLIFVAEDHAGASCANVIRSVTGQNAQAQDLGTQNGAKALADAMASVSKLMDATLEQSRKMMEFQAQRLENQQETIADFHEFFMAIRKAELEHTEQESAASKIMMEQVSQAGPMLMAMIQHWATSGPAKQGIGGAAAAAVNAATNGAKVS
jgi:hypothetical protein